MMSDEGNIFIKLFIDLQPEDLRQLVQNNLNFDDVDNNYMKFFKMYRCLNDENRLEFKDMIKAITVRDAFELILRYNEPLFDEFSALKQAKYNVSLWMDTQLKRLYLSTFVFDDHLAKNTLEKVVKQ